MKPINLYITICLSLLILGGCTLQPSGPKPDEPVSITLEGNIRSIDDYSYVPGAKISIKDITATTDSRGRFSITARDVTNSDSLCITKDGFVDYRMALSSFSRDTLEVELTIKPVDTIAEIDPANPGGNTITTPDMASVYIPELHNISEPLILSVTTFDITGEEMKSVPGDFSAVDANNDETTLMSHGIIAVTVKGRNTGTTYDLQGMGSFEISVPVPDIPGTPPETLTLAWFDDESCTWVPEGTISIAADDPGFYRGTVTHFSLWNLYKSVPPVSVYGIMNDPLPPDESYHIRLETTGFGITAYTNKKSFHISGIPKGTHMTATVTKQSTQQTWTRFFYSDNESGCIHLGTFPDEGDGAMPPPRDNHFPLHIKNPGAGIYPGLYITQCVDNGLQRVWQVGRNRSWAEFRYIENQYDACGPQGALKFRDSQVEADTWITWCTGSADIPTQRLVWKANGSNFAPYLYSEEGNECSALSTPTPQPCPPADNAPLYLSGNMGGIFPGLVITHCIEGGLQRKWIVDSSGTKACFVGIVGQEGFCGPPYENTEYKIPHLWIHTDPGNRVAAGTWITWCTGYADREEYVWLTDESGFVGIFKWPQEGDCEAYQTPPPVTPAPTTPPPPQVGVAEPCARCILEKRQDIISLYQAEGWDIDPANWYNIVDDWSGVDPEGYADEKAGCGSICDTVPYVQPSTRGLSFIAFDDPPWFDPAQKNAIPPLLSDLGVNTVTFTPNFDIYIDTLSDRPDMFEAARFLIEDAGVELIGCFVGIPLKYRKADHQSDAGSYNGDSAMIGEIREFLIQFLNLGIKKWFVWYEPDSWSTSEIRNVSSYAQVYNAFFNAARAVSPEIKVAPNCGFSSTAWLGTVISMISGYDAISYHPYPNTNDPADAVSRHPPYLNINGIKALESYGVKLWLTAYGMLWSNDTTTGENDQAMRLKAGLTWLNGRPSVEHAFYFRCTDVIHSNGYRETFGLLRDDVITTAISNRKLAYEVFRNPF
ncbi:MAG: hypothetical protein JXJ04_14765 [Spirochaetales bacterium]|nr:hypothetical protein [Spirochaetales bacterium]